MGWIAICIGVFWVFPTFPVHSLQSRSEHEYYTKFVNIRCDVVTKGEHDILGPGVIVYTYISAHFCKGLGVNHRPVSVNFWLNLYRR